MRFEKFVIHSNGSWQAERTPMRPAIICISFIFASCPTAGADEWSRFRGPNGTGVADAKIKMVAEFSETKNLNWKTPMPGAGASGPIVVGDRIFVTCYSGYGESRKEIGEMENLKRHVVCVNRNDGKIIWQKEIEPHLPEDKFTGMGVPEHGYSSSTPVSDGKHVYVFFGKTGVFAFDMDGKQVWKTSVGTASGSRKWGSAASPILVGGVLVIVASDEDEAVYGLDPKTGNEIWKTKTPKVANVWNTPIVVGGNDDPEILISLPKEVWALDPKTGERKWFVTNGVDAPSVSTSLVLDDDVVIAMGGRTRTCTAIRIGGEDDVTESNTVWTGRAISSIVTPVVYKDHMYVISRGVATCIDTEKGEEKFKERVSKSAPKRTRRGPGGMDYSSPVLVDGKIYQFTKTGTCYVIEAKPEFKLLATNSFESDDSEFNGTPAISDNKMYVRSNKFLYSIGAKSSK